MKGNINVNDTQEFRFLIGSEIHIQNTDLTMSQSMAQVAQDSDLDPTTPLPHARTDP